MATDNQFNAAPTGEADEALRASEERFRAAFADAAIGMALVDLEGRFQRVNRAYCELIGYREEELAGLTFIDVTHPDDRPANREKIRRVLAGEVPSVVFEKRYIRKNGEAVWVQARVSVARDRHGQPASMIALTQDITSSRLAQDALRASEERFRLVVENSPDMVFTMDRDFRFTWVSGHNERTRLHDAVGKIDADIIGPAEAARIRAVMNRVMETGNVERVETAPVINGVQYYHETALARRLDATGNVAGISAYIRDVTDRTRAQQAMKLANETLEQRVAERTAALEARTRELAASEEALRRQTQLLRLVLDTMGDGIAVADGSGQFVMFNPAATQIIGIAPAQMPVSEWPRHFGFFLPDQITPYPAAQLPLQRAMRGESADDVEIFIRRDARGQGHWISATARPIRDPHGTLTGGVTVIRDLTERKRAHADLQESERHYRELAEHNRLLVREVEHRVGNNLAGLLGLVAVMRERATDVRSFADAMESRLRGMAHVHRMLGESGWRSLGLRALVTTTFQAARDPACPQANEQIEGADLPIAAAQALPITLILLEWYTNSCKYGAHSRPGGTLRVNVSEPVEDQSKKIRLTWKEFGGPPPRNPIVPSLGTHLVQAFATHELGGLCQMTYLPSGADHWIEFPCKAGVKI